MSAAALDIAKAAQAASSPYIDVCGHGRVLSSELDLQEGAPPPAWLEALDQQRQQAQEQVLKRMERGPTKQRVVAALLRQDLQTAAQLAAQTDDATAYKLALRACREDAAYRSAFAARQAMPAPPAASDMATADPPQPGAQPTACAALTLERMEMLGPHDAWPLLIRLSDARSRRDEVAAGQALHQLATRSFQPRSARPLSEVLAEAVDAEPTMGESWALMMATGADMAASFDGSPITVARACSPQQLVDANRRQLCEQVVRRLPDITTELKDARTLYVLEERLSMPHSRQAASQAEMLRLQEVMAEGSMSWMKAPTCANFTLAGQQVAALARRGELVYLHAKLNERGGASVPR
ncbi:hypothetical protein ACG04R_26765 [Roseateles sp. BYS78W]|uniref:Uncharacterized protein n=1 Tax=Pelomonas candidula TaxID=3299025 RepID=A0ABW7HK57_9BURK